MCLAIPAQVVEIGEAAPIGHHEIVAVDLDHDAVRGPHLLAVDRKQRPFVELPVGDPVGHFRGVQLCHGAAHMQ